MNPPHRKPPKPYSILRSLLTVAAVVFVALALLLVFAEMGAREVRRNEVVRGHVHELEHSLMQTLRSLEEGTLSTLPAQMSECHEQLIAVRSAADDAAFSATLRTRLQKVEDQAASFLEAARRVDARVPAEQREQAEQFALSTLAATDDFLNELNGHSRASQRPGVWSALHILEGIAGLLVVSIALAEGRAARALRRLYHDRHALMESTPQVLLSVDAHGNAVRWNERLVHRTGLGVDALRGMRITDLFEAGARPNVVQALDVVLTEGLFECDLPLLCDGHPKQFAWLFSRNEQEDGHSWITISGHDISDRHLRERRLEDALKRSEAGYRGLFENAHDAILILEPETEIVLDANPRACMLYDFSCEQFVGKSMLDLSVNAGRSEAYVRRLIEESGNYLPFDSQQCRRDGTIIEVEIKAARVTYQGRPAILSINRDVTARNREDRRVRESEERFRLLLESVVDYAIYMLDPSGWVVSWNEGAERISGFAPADVMGRSFEMFYTAEQQAAGAPGRDLDEAAVSGRLEREELRIRKDGSSFHAAVVLTRVIDDQGRLRGFAEVTHDITQKKRLDETQQEILAVIHNVAQEWTKTFDAVGTPILLLDDDGRVSRCNHAAARLAGKPLKELLGCDPRDLNAEPWRVIASISDFFRAHGLVTEGRAEDEGSGQVWQVSATPVDLQGERRLIVVTHDLTAVTQLEESLRRAQLTAALGALVAGVAHEVRNPLFTISATLDTCEARLTSVPELKRYMDPLREEVTRLNELMEELLDYGRPHPLQLAEVSLVDVARAAISQARAASTREFNIRLDAEEGLARIVADRRRLQQVLRNIIDNAVQHSGPHEPVVVRLRNDRSGAVRCEVLDSGPGLSDEDLAQAFTPFYTKRKGGTGLGLAIAQKFVLALGGEITLRNRGERGAVVTVRLPSAAALSDTSAVPIAQVCG
ncbi:MAG: PAS domain S-box protein [Acidobacteriota bacterium]